MTHRTFPLVAAALIAATGWLAGCGGGGDDTRSGRVVGPVVANLRYESAAFSGRTGADGSFSYRDGEQVRFYVGDVHVGSATGADTVSAFTLAGIVQVPLSGAEMRREFNRIGRWWNDHATPFEVAANIAAFLQTVDADGDAGNGIAVPDALHAVAAGRTLRFDARATEFAAQPALGKLMADARAASAWSGPRAVRGPGAAMRTLYAALGLTPRLLARARVSQDRNADGLIDDQSRYLLRPDGNLEHGEIDYGSDGATELSWDVEYDAAGRETGYRYDELRGGAVRSTIQRSFYDPNGHLVRNEFDHDADGTTDEIHRFERNADGTPARTLFDNDGDGRADAALLHEYDAAGREVGVRFDRGIDGRFERVQVSRWDSLGRKLSIEIDNDADGRVDERETRLYDDAGNLVQHNEDHDADGRPERSARFSFDAAGNRLSEEHDDDGDGRPELVRRFSYDASGRLLSEQQSDGDGVIERIVTYSHDDADNAVRVTTDHGGDGSIDRFQTLEVDADGHPVRWEDDHDADGTVDEREIVAWVAVDGFPQPFWLGSYFN